jgi:hypothetical protein
VCVLGWHGLHLRHIPSIDRATSPSCILCCDSASVRHSHHTSSPLQMNPSIPITSLLSGVNGHFSLDCSQTPDGPSVKFGSPHDSSLLSRAKLVTAQTQTQPHPKSPSPQTPALKPTYSQALKAPTRPHDPGKPSHDPLPPSGPCDQAHDQTPDLSRDVSHVVPNTTRSRDREKGRQCLSSILG